MGIMRVATCELHSIILFVNSLLGEHKDPEFKLQNPH